MRTLFRVLGRANARRDKTLNKLLDKIVQITQDGGYPEEAQFADEYIRKRLYRYDGLATFSPLIEWVGSELDFYFRAKEAIADIERAERRRFMDIYSSTRRVAFAGAWSVLRRCIDLGATEQEAEEVVQQTFARIFDNIEIGWTTARHRFPLASTHLPEHWPSGGGWSGFAVRPRQTWRRLRLGRWLWPTAANCHHVLSRSALITCLKY